MEIGEEILRRKTPPAEDKALYINLLKTQFTKIGAMGFFKNLDVKWDERTKVALEKLELEELHAISRSARLLLLAENSSA